MLRYLIGIGIPYLGVIGVLPWAAAQDRYVLGVPFIFMWIFAWFVLTSGCLFACWMLFDRRASAACARIRCLRTAGRPRFPANPTHSFPSQRCACPRSSSPR